MTSRRHYPSIGKIIEVKPESVSRSSRLKGKSPLSFGADQVLIKNKNLDGILSADVQNAIDGDETPFRIREVKEKHPAKIVDISSGHITVEFLSEEEIRANEDSESLFNPPEREESVDGEWEGTPQEVDDEKTKRRNETFNEGDRRGSKNDLL